MRAEAVAGLAAALEPVFAGATESSGGVWGLVVGFVMRCARYAVRNAWRRRASGPLLELRGFRESGD